MRSKCCSRMQWRIGSANPVGGADVRRVQRKCVQTRKNWVPLGEGVRGCMSAAPPESATAETGVRGRSSGKRVRNYSLKVEDWDKTRKLVDLVLKRDEFGDTGRRYYSKTPQPPAGHL